MGELMRSMSSLEYGYWMALAALEPIGAERGDYHTAHIVSTLANINRDAKKRTEPYELTDFLLFREKPELDDAEVQRRLLAVFPIPAKEEQH